MPGIALIIIVMINITSGMQLSRLAARLYRAQVRLVKYAYMVWVCMSCPTGLGLPVWQFLGEGVQIKACRTLRGVACYRSVQSPNRH